MSERVTIIEAHSGIDRRARRSRALLADALMTLGAEADVDALGVGDLVEEAGVSRSTFYQHYASKEDFLIRSFVNMLQATEAAHAAHKPDRKDILPSEPLFHHVAGAAESARAMARSEAFPRQMAAGETALRAIAETNLARRMPHWSSEQRREAAVFIAGGFIALMRWWMQGGLQQSPERMQAAFARITQNVLNEKLAP